MYRYKWKPNQEQKREFAEKMNEIKDFCRKNHIQAGLSHDSYYFNIRGQNYRVSNHSIETSNARAFNVYDEQIRELYHPDGRGNIKS